jgi:hypothetical protein
LSPVKESALTRSGASGILAAIKKKLIVIRNHDGYYAVTHRVDCIHGWGHSTVIDDIFRWSTSTCRQHGVETVAGNVDMVIQQV